MTKVFLVVVLGTIAVMTVLWGLGKALWWLRVTFPPRRPVGRRRRGEGTRRR